MPLEPGDAVTSLMRPDLSYTVIERTNHMVRVRSSDGTELWIARSVLKKLEPEKP